MKQIFKHKENGKYYKTHVERETNINTFVECDKDGNETIEKRPWSEHPEKQYAVLKGFDRLEKVQ